MAKRRKENEAAAPVPETPVSGMQAVKEDAAPAAAVPPGPEPAHASSVECPLCGGASAGEAPPGFARCGVCGVLFREERLSPDELARLREHEFKDAFALPHHEAKRAAKKQALDAMRGYFRVKTGKPAPLNAFGRNLLEVGCGLGFGLRAYSDYGWTVFGTESAVTAFEYSKRQMFDVRHGLLEDAGFGKTRFDLVVFPGGFGELPDPKGALERLKGLLHPHGLVCVVSRCIPDDGEMPPVKSDEQFVFTRDALAALFERNGFEALPREEGASAVAFWFRLRREDD